MRMGEREKTIEWRVFFVGRELKYGQCELMN